MSTDPRIEAAARSMWDNHIRSEGAPSWDAILQTPVLAAHSAEGLTVVRAQATDAIAAADQAATITTMEGLDALPVGSRILLAGVHLERDPEPVDDSVWRDLSNALHLDDVDMRFLLERHTAHVTRWDTK